MTAPLCHHPRPPPPSFVFSSATSCHHHHSIIFISSSYSSSPLPTATNTTIIFLSTSYLHGYYFQPLLSSSKAPVGPTSALAIVACYSSLHRAIVSLYSIEKMREVQEDEHKMFGHLYGWR
ncbi:hypothetical protein CRG98_031024 [Punica granatum]|nr:hypothetical protein CRG98_031024 [Punica granatum]